MVAPSNSERKPEQSMNRSPLMLAPGFELHALDQAALGIAGDVDDLAFHAPHPAPGGPAAQELGVEAGVEMIGVGEGRADRARVFVGQVEHALPAHRHGEAVVEPVADIVAGGLSAQPVMLEVEPAPALAESAEGVDIAAAGLVPADELDAQLEAALGGGHELGLVEPEHRVELADMRQRRLADAHRADLVGLDQGQRIVGIGEQPREAGRAHPARGTAADDDDAQGRRGWVRAGLHDNPLKRKTAPPE
jgi:hypothetical protein